MVKGKYYTCTNKNGKNFNVKQTWLKRHYIFVLNKKAEYI